MRKTSGFFKRKFGSTTVTESDADGKDLVDVQHTRYPTSQSEHRIAHPSQSSLGTDSCSSSPALPHSSRSTAYNEPHRLAQAPPPVPSIPSSFKQSIAGNAFSPGALSNVQKTVKQKTSMKKTTQQSIPSPTFSPSSSSQDSTETDKIGSSFVLLNRSLSGSPMSRRESEPLGSSSTHFQTRSNPRSHTVTNHGDSRFSDFHQSVVNTGMKVKTALRSRPSMSSLTTNSISHTHFTTFPSKSTSNVHTDHPLASSPKSRRAFSPAPRPSHNSQSTKPTDKSRSMLTADNRIGSASFSDQGHDSDLRLSASPHLSTHSEPNQSTTSMQLKLLVGDLKSEEDQLRDDLGRWKLDADGVLSGDPSPPTPSGPLSIDHQSTSRPIHDFNRALAQFEERSKKKFECYTEAGLSRTHQNLPSSDSTASFFSTQSQALVDEMARAPENFHKSITSPIGSNMILPSQVPYRPGLPLRGSPSVLPNLTTSCSAPNPSSTRFPDVYWSSRSPSTQQGLGSNHPAGIGDSTKMEPSSSLPVWNTSSLLSATRPASDTMSPTPRSPIAPWMTPQVGQSSRFNHPHDLIPGAVANQRLRTQTEESSVSSVQTLNIQIPQPAPLSSMMGRSKSDGHQRGDERSEPDEAEFDSELYKTPSIRLVSPINNVSTARLTSDQPGSVFSSPFEQHASQVHNSLHNPSIAYQLTGSPPQLPSPLCQPSCFSSPRTPTLRDKPKTAPTVDASGTGPSFDHFSVGLGLKLEREPNEEISSDLNGLQTPKNEHDDLEETSENGSGCGNWTGMKEDLPGSGTSTFSVTVSGPPTEVNDSKGKQRTPSMTRNLSRRPSHVTPITVTPAIAHPNQFVNPSLSTEDNAKFLARRMWEEDESIIRREKLAEWLGSSEENQLAVITLKYYMSFFDFSGLRIDTAFRKLCLKLFLKAETQQVDRILVEFSKRFWASNASNLYFSVDIVHALSYSILLLNTDLHIVDTHTRMSRPQFIRNTMETIQPQVEAFEDQPDLPLTLAEFVNQDAPRLKKVTSIDTDSVSLSTAASVNRVRPSLEKWKGAFRNGSGGLPGPGRTAKRSDGAASKGPSEESKVGSGELEISIRPSTFSRALFEKEIDGLLKDVYIAIKGQAIFQSQMPRRGPGSLTIERSSTSYKRTSLRGLGGLLGAEGTRPPSPASSMTTSSISGASGGAHGLQAYSNSSLGSHAYTTLTSPSIGFASNLSQSIIREQKEEECRSESETSSDGRDEEELALLGAPWAKEGILHRKQYWDTKGKRHKDKSWAQVFVVIHKGQLKMFQFGESGSSSGGGGGAIVGGGNWQTNAQAMGELELAHSLSSALPSGYNRDRPHAFVLTLANGSSYFFQAGTTDLINEWVSTCNYWSARLSKEPLKGGVSNMDYGWKLVEDELEAGRLSSRGPKFKDLEKDDGPMSTGTMTMINDWTAPVAPSSRSTLAEEVQLEKLCQHCTFMQLELEKHNYLRKPMIDLYANRSPNLSKALVNWEKKSQYLLAEIIKYTTYIDALESGISAKNNKKGQKLVDSLLKKADL
ncbi:hypothetical protein CROQUDRAFT_93873 [Cronartium quercuum f. sp. fusiforme G11]|uniref:SEC7 domain-containing protein n=1 Tax=Cronartium quercuum f. sp. fusiforme G11 TaxID=708437 RepID=A0A9P6NJX4_9BASI|nr:hypothetical protein CROQUDRAFT_93873 [Cronartium quercuum f. sp. fusiforme G11]